MIKISEQKIYCPSLIQRSDRRETVAESFKKLGIDFEFYDSHQGHLYLDVYNNLKQPHYFKHENYIACLFTHLNIITNAYKQGLNYVTIIEDDAILHKDFKILEQKIGVEEYDLLYLGYIPLTDDMYMWTYNLPKTYINENLYNAENLWGLFGYSISRKLMGVIIEKYRHKIDMEMDRYFVNHIQRNPEYKTYAIQPQLVALKNDVSDLDFKLHEDIERKSINTLFSTREDYV